MPVDVLLTGVLHADGTTSDVSISAGVVVAGGGDAPAEVTIDLDGRLLLPATVEVHAHLDKAFTADRFPNPRGDLGSAIEVMRAKWPSVDQGDVEARAARTARRLLQAGATAIRTHTDVNVESGMKSVRALTEVRRQLGGLLDLQVVALASPLTGPDGSRGRALLAEALAFGVDVVGSCPNIEDDGLASIDHTLAAAREAGLPADLHIDEVLDVSVQHLTELARRVERAGLQGRVTASHCVSHGLLDPESQRQVAEALASAGVAVVTNPRTNLFLQARGREQAPPRGMVGVGAMLDAGVLVAAGADNVQDPFFTVGRCDPLETASYLVVAAHRSVDEAWRMVSDDARAVLGLPPPGVGPGSPADYVAVRAGSVREAIADQPADRMVFRHGRLVARSTVDEWLADV